MPMMRRVGAAPGVNRAYRTKADATGLAAPRRVGILGVADADAEAGDAAVEHLDALAARCRWQRLRKRSVSSLWSAIRGAPGSWATCWATHPPRSPANACERLRTL